jgi:N,N'-diacetyllegionaminate synthase
MVYLIAEVGVNHKGNLDYALEHLHAAKEAGADAVKFQTFKARELASFKYAPDQVDFFHAVELQFPEFARLFQEAGKVGIDFLSTPFDIDAVDFLDKLPVSAFKVASGDLTNHSLLAYIARKGKHIFLSTGMSNIGEVADALSVIRRNGNRDVTLFHCVSLYPTPPERANLLAVRTLAETFDMPAGYSDHTIGVEACIAAVALGAVVVEKHFTLDKSQPGPDIALSCNPEELASLRKSIDLVNLALGDGRKIPQKGEDEAALAARRSIFTTCLIKKGEIITPDFLALHRPGTGISACQFCEVVGHRARIDIEPGEMLRWEMLEGV